MPARLKEEDLDVMEQPQPDIALPPRDGDIQERDDRASVFQAVREWLRAAFGRTPDATLKEVLEEVLEEHEDGNAIAMPAEEKTMLKKVLGIGEVTVHNIMIPRTDIVAVPDMIGLEELKRHLLENRHTRTPVYNGTLDQVRGFLHVKDMLAMLSGDRPYDLKQVIRQVLFVPPSMKVLPLLAKMRRLGNHMAIVVDEFGGTDGLVTMEDLVEEIVGEIQDEHDEQEKRPFMRVSDAVVEADARVRIEELERELGLNLITEENAEDFDTLGGLIFFQLGRVPVKGEMVTHPAGLRFEIVDADARSIHKVRILLNAER